MASTEGSAADIVSIAEFGVWAMEKMATFLSGAGGPIGEVSSAQLGLAGMDEGVAFSAWYAAKLQELGLLVEDVDLGLQALGYGAIVIAENYRTSDLSQQQELDSVTAAFSPAAGAPSAASDAQRALDEAADASDAEARYRNFHPLLPPAQENAPPVASVVTPQEEVDWVRERHPDADWRPEPPGTYVSTSEYIADHPVA